jgi:excinuclease UvrABC nuclease subunit
MSFDWVEFQYKDRPRVKGVYGIMLNNQWLYIGKAKNIWQRLGAFAHTACTMSEGLTGVKYFYIQTNDNEEIETKAIKFYNPIWQIEGGKGYWLDQMQIDKKWVYVSNIDCFLPSEIRKLKIQWSSKAEQFNDLTWDV